LAIAAPVRAFSDPTSFTEPAERGGGGGRFFTGSPVDGYSCAVCHLGGSAPALRLQGLPTIFTPGETYEVELAWDGAEQHALTLELVDERGSAAGSVALPDAAEVEPSGHCEQSSSDPVASYISVTGSRQIVGVNPCGAASLRFRFVPRDVPRIAFAVSMVRSDNSESADGDGVLDLRQVVLREGERPQVDTVTAESGGCSAAPAGSARGGALSSLCVLLLALARRRSVSSSRS
jgi:hypothetical protein